MAEYRIEFSVQRSRDDETGEFEEIGFGSSGSWSSVNQAAYMLTAYLEHRTWETRPGMPDPETVDRNA